MSQSRAPDTELRAELEKVFDTAHEPVLAVECRGQDDEPSVLYANPACARLLGIEPLRDYDRYAPLAEAAGRRRFDEAREIVLSAYADFAPEMAETMKEVPRGISV